MTILEATIKLVTWFRTNESFELSRDFINIIAITETKKEDLVALKCALKNLCDSNILGKETVDNTDYFILNRPLDSMEQNITASYSLCIDIATIINLFCEKMKIKEDVCDFRDIRQKDIKNLVYLLNNFYEQQNKSEEEESKL